MHRVSSYLFAILLSITVVGSSQGAGDFTARLTGAQETPGAATPALGTGCFTLTSAGLDFYVTVEGLSGLITAAEFANGAPGVPGLNVRDILPDFSGTNSADGLWSPADAQPLTGALISELMAGNIYVNIHTPLFGAGEIRGQVQLSNGVHFTANLQGRQVNPPVVTPATGAASLTLAEDGLHYKITVNNLVGGLIIDAHISNGEIGVNGPPLFPIAPTFVGNTATGFVPITAVDRRSLLAGNMYVDIITPGFPGGELRGQIVLAGGFGFSIRADATQETPPNPSPGLASGSATLTASGLVLDLSANNLIGGGPIIGAALHRGPPLIAGPVVRDFSGEFVAPNTAQVLWRVDDVGAPLTHALMADLFSGNIYVNIRTPAFPAGEIRGQVLLNTPGPTPEATYTANLTARSVVPPVPSAGLGTGTFQLVPGGLSFRATFDGIFPIIGVEFWDAPIGVNGGGPVRVIGGAEFIGPNSIAGLWSPFDALPFTAAMMTELFKGNIYLNVRTGPFPGGELRGQLLPGSGGEFEARLTSAQATPPNGTIGTGTGSFTLTPHGVAFNITSDALTGPITAANIRLGDRGVPGPIVRAFLGGEFVTANTLAGVWKPTDAMPLTPALVNEMMKGNLYVNLQTVVFPPGEIRGQITLSGGEPHGARPMGRQEVPPVLATKGAGILSGTLNDEGYLIRMSASDLLAAVTGSQIQNAPPTVNGPVVRPIYPGELFGTGTVDAVWKITDADPLTIGLLGQLEQENLYINVLTAAHPAGEIRGQIGSPRSVVGVGEPLVGSSELRLASAPNPVHHGVADISFYLPERSNVRLEIYDVTGAHVVQLIEGARQAGWNHVRFDTSRLSSGVYLCCLDAGARRVSDKLLVMR